MLIDDLFTLLRRAPFSLSHLRRLAFPVARSAAIGPGVLFNKFFGQLPSLRRGIPCQFFSSPSPSLSPPRGRQVLTFRDRGLGADSWFSRLLALPSLLAKVSYPPVMLFSPSLSAEKV